MQPPRKTVFHIHTDYSDDCNASIHDVIESARCSRVQCVAITDHDTIEGARQLAAAGAPLQVIVGEEISTADGHLIGLFLRECVEPGMSVRRTAEAIRAQGGLVVVPHPYNRIFGCSLRDRVNDILDLIDVVEVSNAQNLLPFPNRKTESFARQHRFPMVVGADSHHRGYLDSCHQWMEPFDGPDTFLASLRTAHFVVRRHPLTYFVRSAHVLLRDKLGWNLPEGYGRNCPRPRPQLELTPVPVRSE